MEAEGRVLHNNWDLYDTRHTVFRPRRMAAEELESGYRRAYREFYRWSNIARGAMAKAAWIDRLRHLGYSAGWKKFEPLWDLAIRARRAGRMLPLLEGILDGFGQARPNRLVRHSSEKLNDQFTRTRIDARMTP
jgi:hypothetical protein